MPGLDVRIWLNPESQRLGRLFDDGARILFDLSNNVDAGSFFEGR